MTLEDFRHPPKVSWQISLPQVAINAAVTLVSIGFAVGVIKGTLEQKINELTDWRASVDKRIESLDEKGTRASNQRNSLEDAKNVEQDRRITNMEQTLQQVVPDVREIKTKIDIVARMLDEQQKSRK